MAVVESETCLHPPSTPTAAQAWPALITSEDCRYISFPSIPPFNLSFLTETKIFLPAKGYQTLYFPIPGAAGFFLSLTLLLLYQVPMRLGRANGWS